MRRWADWASLLAVVVVLCGCSGPPWWVSHPGRTSNCGPAAEIRVAAHVTALGGCVGLFVTPPRTATIHVGQELDVHMTQEPSGSGTGLVPFYPLPHSSSASVMTRIDVSADGSTASYRALQPGRIALLTKARCLVRGTRRISTAPWCPILDVTVIR